MLRSQLAIGFEPPSRDRLRSLVSVVSSVVFLVLCAPQVTRAQSGADQAERVLSTALHGLLQSQPASQPPFYPD